MIYFVQAVEGGPVKIGFSDDVPRRIRQLEIHYGRSLVVLATREGGETEERLLHERFAHLRLPKFPQSRRAIEQFRPAPELWAFLGLAPREETAESCEAMLPINYDSEAIYRKVPLDSRLVGMAKILAKYRGVTLAEFLSEIAAEPVSRAYGEYIQQVAIEQEVPLS